MLTQIQAQYLLDLPKEIDGGIKSFDLAQEKITFKLTSPDDDDWTFLVKINSSRKISFRISFHHQEDKTKEGLLRIDYNSGHRNPEVANQFVPDFLVPYTGIWIQNEPHIHFFVESYKDLAWAIPLKDYSQFSVTEINNMSDFSNAFYAFADKIKITTKFAVQQGII